MDIYLKNKQLNEAEIRDRKTLLDSKPLTLRIILTNQCNINCIMCNLGSQKNKFTIPYDAIKKIVDFLPYLERIDWQGGEVFLVEYFEEIIQKASLYPNIHQTLQTNGLFLDRKWSDLLARNGITVLFSLDGARKDTYEYVRRGARFDDFLENLSIFNEYRKKYGSTSSMILCVCVMKANYKELEDFVDFAIKYNFDRISFGAIHGSNAINENIFDPMDSDAIAYIKKIFPRIEKMCEENKVILECFFKNYLMYKETNSLVAGHNKTQDDNKQLRCNFPWTNLCIDAIRGGNVYPECLCSQSIGNIMEDSIFDIWNAMNMQQYRLAIVSNDFRHICSKYCMQVR